MSSRHELFRQKLGSDVLIGDGAMATWLYQQGHAAGSSTEELCLKNQEWVREAHMAYLHAGAQVIETNSYAANREALARYGLERKTTRINRAAVQIARQAVELAEAEAFVVGSIGSIAAARVMTANVEEFRDTFEEQAVALLHEGVDGLVLETFFDLEELLLALDVVRPLVASSGVPIIAQCSLLDVERTRDGYLLSDAYHKLQEAGADMVGLNCRLGPAEILRALERAVVPEGLGLSAFPNAGRPAIVDGEFAYKPNYQYFGDSAVKLWEQGVSLIGGCCGTTPEHIQAIAGAVSGMKRLPRVNPENAPRIEVFEREVVRFQQSEMPTIIDLVEKRHTVIVEFDSPRDLDVERYVEGSHELYKAGADAITIADNSLATTRMSNMALGSIIKRELGIEPVVHVACRDRNLIGQQSHLMGLHALGINQILVITGDPARVGDLPGASTVFDMSSFDLIRMVKQLNQGVAFSGRPMKNQARFVCGAAFNPHVRNLEAAVARLERKVEAGADYIMTQPVYDLETMLAIKEATAHIKVPIFIGIMPLTSTRNAEFLHNEVPGIKISQKSRERIKRFEGAAARAEGVEMCKELLDEAVKHYNGIYLITPFNYFEMTVELTKHVRAITQVTGRASTF
ncbi:homocysteine S-methyltransferase [Tumebacillus sp. BK434]|uniref:bifunctional homocysteine S-methyltransferase/methylenetetrahydrofolate reductase n=1 Tax=Tumebacillus sp. BK434 TaxID=2512169 RepID=UPI0010D78158|nr:bifunctional homocysteine S-methyltransferase/methylenetetrahydrofolate reductase [Tumebacillus sp. BK434]TCP58179.1 homocysteine S-methyltransferase [Tumebacillus sp. BK434]